MGYWASSTLSLLPYTQRSCAERPRAPASSADPSILAKAPIESEDDVVFLRELPKFGGRLGARDSELLLSYLTVPYLRIPLVVSFFATDDRVQTGRTCD